MEFNSDQIVFDKLFRLLEPGAVSVEAGFQRCRFKLIKFFGWRRCDDPENLADETIARLLKNVRAGQEISADNPYSYVYAIASNVFKEFVRDKKKSGVTTEIEEIKDRTLPMPAMDCKRQCLEQLTAEKQELLARYYLDPDDRNEIAREYGLSLNALRLQIYRIKAGLRRCWEDCLKRGDSMRN